MVFLDKRYNNDMIGNVINNTDIKDIKYINSYDGYYIVMDSKYIYLFNNDYVEIYKGDISKLYNNKNDYDLIYRDGNIMYMESFKNKDGVIFKYYDIFTYELIDEIMVGGN